MDTKILSYQIIAGNLIDDVSISSLSGIYTLSQAMLGDYTNTLTIAPDVNKAVNTTIYVKFTTPSEAGTFNSEVINSSSGVISKSLEVLASLSSPLLPSFGIYPSSLDFGEIIMDEIPQPTYLIYDIRNIVGITEFDPQTITHSVVTHESQRPLPKADFHPRASLYNTAEENAPILDEDTLYDGVPALKFPIEVETHNGESVVAGHGLVFDNFNTNPMVEWIDSYSGLPMEADQIYIAIRFKLLAHTSYPDNPIIFKLGNANSYIEFSAPYGALDNQFHIKLVLNNNTIYESNQDLTSQGFYDDFALISVTVSIPHDIQHNYGGVSYLNLTKGSGQGGGCQPHSVAEHFGNITYCEIGGNGTPLTDNLNSMYGWVSQAIAIIGALPLYETNSIEQYLAWKVSDGILIDRNVESDIVMLLEDESYLTASIVVCLDCDVPITVTSSDSHFTIAEVDELDYSDSLVLTPTPDRVIWMQIDILFTPTEVGTVNGTITYSADGYDDAVLTITAEAIEMSEE